MQSECQGSSPSVSRAVIYVAILIMLTVIIVGAIKGAPPVYLAVAFIGEIVLVSTAHLSTVIEQSGLRARSAQSADHQRRAVATDA